MAEKKRGRPKKKSALLPEVPEEVQAIIQEVVKKEEQEVHKEVQQYVAELKQQRSEWDVPKDAAIHFFDKRLSYELTGYKPIDEEHGLDFRPEWFTEARDSKNRTGKYCQFVPGSKAYADFWHKEYIRSREGMTVNGYTITGPHYFFLNYYQLPNTDSGKAGSSRGNIYPNFYVYQYEFFHYYELCRILRKNCGLMKSRGIGFSEINACLCACMYSTFRGSNTLMTAASKNYVDKTLEKIWGELNFLNDHTEGGFFKLRQVSDTAYKKRASYYKIVQGQKIEDGWKSQIEGIIADDDSKIRGDRVDLLVLEEAGSNPKFRRSFIKGEALVSLGGNKFGIILAGGTGGDSGPNLEGLSNMYYDPEGHDVLPFLHNYTQDGDWTKTCYFIPAYIALYNGDYMDERGFCDAKRGKEYYESERRKRAADPRGLVEYSAEYCFNAEEAFALEGTNKFNKVLIAEQITRIKVLKECPPIENGDFQFMFKQGSDRTNMKNVTGVRWIQNNNGLVHILEHPIWMGIHEDEEGNSIQYGQKRNLYVAGVDGIDIGMEQTSEETRDPSKFCIVIKKRAFGLQEPKYVAYYMFRPDDERQAFQTAMKLMLYYNCRCNIEATRLSFLNWAKGRGWGDYFMRRPRATYPEASKKIGNAIGTPATPTIISHQTDLIANYVEDYCHNIWFYEFLDQLNRYTDEKKGKFDIIAAMAMAELADEELGGVVATDVEPEEENKFQDIGYYKDERGIRHFGVIPRHEQPKVRILQDFTNEIVNRNRTSDPRKYS